MPPSFERDRRAAMSRGSLIAVVAALLFAAACTTIENRPDPPTVTLERVRIVNVADGKASLSMILRVANPNRFELAIDSIEYELTLDGRQAANGRSTRLSPLPAQGETEVEFAGRVDVAAIATALMTLGSQLPVQYALKGTVTLRDGSVLALSRKGDIPVARFDRLYGSPPR